MLVGNAQRLSSVVSITAVTLREFDVRELIVVAIPSSHAS